MLAKGMSWMLVRQANYGFSVTYYNKMSPSAAKYAILVRKIRSTISLQEAIQVFEQNFPQIQNSGKTMILQFFNEFYMDQRYFYSNNLYFKLKELLKSLTNLSLYEQTINLSVMQKLDIYFMTHEKRESYQQEVDKCVDALSSMIQTQPINLLDCMNILCIFRVQKYQKLVKKVLLALNNLVLTQIDNDSQNLVKNWGIVIHQLSYIQWSEIRKYKNLLSFLTDHCRVHNSHLPTQYQTLVQIFHNVAKLQMHKVGLKRIPFLINQIIEKYELMIQNLPLTAVCPLLGAFSYLPASYNSKFQAALLRRLYQNLKSPVLYHKIFPFRGLSLEDLDFFYTNPQNCSYLWYQIVYQTDPQNNKYFFRGKILNYLQNLIISKSNSLQKLQKGQKTAQNASRYVIVAQIFYKLGNQIILTKIKKILTKFFEFQGVNNITGDFSFANFITVMTLFENDPIIFNEIKEIFQIKEKLRKNKFKYLKYTENALIAIETHIQNRSKIGQQMVMYFIDTLLNNNSENFSFEIDVRILLQIINATHSNQYYNKVKQSLFKKMKIQDIQCFTQYFLLYENKTFKGTQQVIKKLISMGVNPTQIIKFVSSLKVNLLQNNRGRLQTNLNKYLVENKMNIKASIVDLNEINRFFSILSNFHSTYDFLQYLYLETLQVIEKQIKDNSNDKQISTRLIMQIIFKFQQITPSAQLMNPKNVAMLKKIYAILKKLIQKQKQIFVKAKFLQFYFFYKDYINIPSGIQIQIIHQLQHALNTSKNLVGLSEICLIFLELHCFNFIKLQNSESINYQNAVSQSIRQSKLSIFDIKHFVNILLFHIKIQRNIKSQFKTLKEIMNPLMMESLQMTNQDKNLHIMKPFIEYFRKVDELQKLEKHTLKMLNSYINPAVIQFVLLNYRLKNTSANLLQILIFKLSNASIRKMMNSNTMYILYYFESLFFENLPKYNAFINAIWSDANKYLQGQIQSIENKIMPKHIKTTEDHIGYALGRYPLYMFACIKTGNAEGNKIFQYLANIVRSNPNQFNQRITQKQSLRSMNNSIIKYVMVDQIKAKDKILKPIFNFRSVELCNQILFSASLNQYLNKQNIKFKFKWEVEGFVVPYYLEASKQIIIVVRYRKQNNLQSSNPLNGMHRFEYQVAKKALPLYKIKIYNDLTNVFIQI